MSDPNLETRAHWQRSEGMVTFDTEFRAIFPKVLDAISDEKITDTIVNYHLEGRDIHYDPALTLAASAAALVTRSMTFNMHLPLAFSPTYYGDERTHKHTHRGVEFGILEAAETITHFPINLLAVAEYKRDRIGMGKPLFQNLGDIAMALRQPWFQENVHTAALSANGAWGTFSTKDAILFADVIEHARVELNFATSPDGQTTFSFTDEAVAGLRKALRSQNKHARAIGFIDENDEDGSTSGCPVARRAPQFTKHEYDQSRIAKLAATYDESLVDLQAPRAETAISFGLNHLADYLDRFESHSQKIGSSLRRMTGAFDL